MEDYKTILKSVKIINDKLEAARNLNVELDSVCIAEINKCTARLTSERNLRHEMESMQVHTSEHRHVSDLKKLIERAHEDGVHLTYKESAERLSYKMDGNIKAREILQMMQDYPEREYPIVVPVDPKARKKADDKEKKKKKKKKEPPFPIPAWATELE